MKANEQGRSMVEMLGVLAIIGVLSIGGIAGYTMAMNRYKANQILDMASKISVTAQSRYASNPNENRAQRISDTYASFGLDSGGSSEVYETTFIIWGSQDQIMDLSVRPQEVRDALNSIIGDGSGGWYPNIFNSSDR